MISPVKIGIPGLRLRGDKVAKSSRAAPKAPPRAPGPTGGGGCFVAGTNVRTPFGDRPIQDMEVGDVVLSMDPADHDDWIAIDTRSGCVLELSSDDEAIDVLTQACDVSRGDEVEFEGEVWTVTDREMTACGPEEAR